MSGRDTSPSPSPSTSPSTSTSTSTSTLALTLTLVMLLGVGCTDVGGPWPGGIGAVLRFRGTEHRLIVEEVPPDTASATAGLERGDEVTAIDGAPVVDMDVTEVVRRLRGPVASKVRLTVKRGETVKEIEVEREPYR